MPSTAARPCSSMRPHPFADLFPMLPDDELRRLADDIKASGLRQPIIVDKQDRIIDGRNRQAACELAGVTPTYEPFTGNDNEILKLVVSLNIHRRHLTESQRAMVAASVANLRIGSNQVKAKQRWGDGQKICPPDHALPDGVEGRQICLPSKELKDALDKEFRDALLESLQDDVPSVSINEAAESLSVSPRSVRSARKVQTKGTPELQQAVIDGDIKVSAAAAIAEIPKEQQREVIAAITSPEKAKKEPRPYDVMDDIIAFEKLRNKLSPNWVQENHKAAIRYKFEQMANEV
jgi:DNA-binding Lrp family transcriptional regulator